MRPVIIYFSVFAVVTIAIFAAVKVRAMMEQSHAEAKKAAETEARQAQTAAEAAGARVEFDHDDTIRLMQHLVEIKYPGTAWQADREDLIPTAHGCRYKAVIRITAEDGSSWREKVELTAGIPRRLLGPCKEEKESSKAENAPLSSAQEPPTQPEPQEPPKPKEPVVITTPEPQADADEAAKAWFAARPKIARLQPGESITVADHEIPHIAGFMEALMEILDDYGREYFSSGNGGITISRPAA